MKDFALIVSCALMVSFFVAFFSILIICFIIKCRKKRNLDLMPRALQMIAATPTCDGHYAYVYYDNVENHAELWSKKYSVPIEKYVSTEDITGFHNQLVTWTHNNHQLFENPYLIDLFKRLDILIQDLTEYFAVLKQQKHDLWMLPSTDDPHFSPEICKLAAKHANLDKILGMLSAWVKGGNTLLPMSIAEIPAAGLTTVALQMLVDNLERKIDKIKEYCNSSEIQLIVTCINSEEKGKDMAHILRDSELAKKAAVNLAGLTDARLLPQYLQKKICKIAKPVITAAGFTYLGLAEKSLASLWKCSTGTIVPGSAFAICEEFAKKDIVSCEEVVIAVLFSLFIISAAEYS